MLIKISENFFSLQHAKKFCTVTGDTHIQKTYLDRLEMLKLAISLITRVS